MKPLLLCLLLVFVASAQAQEQIRVRAQAPKSDAHKVEVSVKRIDADGVRVYQVDANGSVAASPEQVWRVLTDYPRMDEFVPDLESCKVLSRSGNEAIIEQFGTARFLFVTRAIHLIVRSVEKPMNSIDISLVSGDMKHYEAHWELVPLPDTGGTRIVYVGKLMPNFYVPGVLGESVFSNHIAHMMKAVLARIDSQRDAPSHAWPSTQATGRPAGAKTE